ncbi:MAG: hypothetical protein ABI620_00850 [Chloroflexota bacterium]
MTTDLDDDAIAKLVRDTAAGWVMPATRLDAPSWRERIRGPRARGITAIGGWFDRVGQAATAAIALTVVGALVAVVITRPVQPGSGPGASASDTSGGTALPSARVEPTGLPRLIVEGGVPDPSKLFVQTERGDFERVDLEMGAIGPALTGGGHGSVLRVLPDGSVACLCLTESVWVGESPTVATVALARFAPGGAPTFTTPIDLFTGEPDPRDVNTFVPERPPHVLTALSFSADGRYGFVGWSLRAYPAWKNGIIVVDATDGTVADRLSLPDGATGDGDSRRVLDAPRVVGLTPGGILLARTWFAWTPVTSSNASYTFDNDLFAASFADGRLSAPAVVPAVAGCGETVLSAGSIAGGGSWVACSSGGSSSTVVRRLGIDGSHLGDTRVAGQSGIDGDMTTISPDGAHLFAWNPVSATLTRVDLATGEMAVGQGANITAAERGPLSALGDWLAPAAAAKTFLRSGIVISPDGSRIYAIGVRSVSSGPEPGGSTGVFVFDATTLASIAIFSPTADFASLAVSRSGRYVYATGLPGVDAAGVSNRNFSASITVFDVNDGSVRLIAGLLGGDALSFASPTLD